MVLKVGMKTWSGNGLKRIRASAKIGDFTEVMIEPDVDYTYLKKIKTKWVVHCGHMYFGFNPPSRERWSKCEHILQKAQEAADFLNSDKIIVHFGLIENDDQAKTGVKNALEFFKNFKDKRIILENSSKVYMYNGKPCLMTDTPKDMKDILEKTGYGFCFDLAHAWVVAYNLGIEPKQMIKDFLKLKPKHFHVLDSSNEKKDDHINLGNGVLDIEFFRDVLKEYSKKHETMISLETPYNLPKNKKEISFMKSIESK